MARGKMRKIQNHPLYACAGITIIAGCLIHGLNFALLWETGYYWLAIPNSLGLLLCALGSSKWPNEEMGWFLVRTGSIISGVCGIVFFSEHLIINVLIEIFGFALNGIGNYYRMQSYEPAVSVEVAA